MAPDTNVRIPAFAQDALLRVAARRGRSRDDTIRWLLDQHLRQQESLDGPERLTHISTVIKYPPPPDRAQPAPARCCPAATARRRRGRPTARRVAETARPKSPAIGLDLSWDPRAAQTIVSRTLTRVVARGCAFRRRGRTGADRRAA